MLQLTGFRSSLFNHVKYDIPSGIAVFFVAIPLCLGIAHASGAPLLSGLISGVVGGIVVGFFSKSHLSVSGPAAGLTAIVLSGIHTLGSYEALLVATFIAGIVQLVIALLKAGNIASYIPNTVINGMLSAIGVILLLKMFPHLIGYDVEEIGVMQFTVGSETMTKAIELPELQEQNTFTVLMHSLSNISWSGFIIGISSLLFLIVWDKKPIASFKHIPGSILVVVVAIGMGVLLNSIPVLPKLHHENYVNIPAVTSFATFAQVNVFPDWSVLRELNVYIVAVTISIVASIESLLSVEAVDKLDPEKRFTPLNNELVAQGIGNIVCGLLGGLPVTALIIRSSVNVSAGAKSRFATIVHGLMIALSVVFLSSYLNLIPIASLAAILVFTGYKLIRPVQFLAYYKRGLTQFIPFVVTVIAIVLTDLLIGVIIGMSVAIISIFADNYKRAVMRVIEGGKRKRIIFGETVTFLHKIKVQNELNNTPEHFTLEIDGSRSSFIDAEIIDLLETFEQTAIQKHIEYIVGGIDKMKTDQQKLNEEMAKKYAQLFENNKSWVNEMKAIDPEYFKKLSQGQSPQFLFIGCSDSLVPADKITGAQPGELFVQRNIANMVVNTDINLMSVLQYSVEVLNVKHVIVCGHYGCGGIKAAMDDSAHGLIDKWLRNIKDVYRLHKHEIDSITDDEQKHKRMVELNVREQVYNLMKTSFVQRNRALYGFPQVHGWVYDISDGNLIDLNIDIDKEFPEFNSMYKIY